MTASAGAVGLQRPSRSITASGGRSRRIAASTRVHHHKWQDAHHAIEILWVHAAALVPGLFSAMAPSAFVRASLNNFALSSCDLISAELSRGIGLLNLDELRSCFACALCAA